MPRKRTVDIAIGQRFERLTVKEELPRGDRAHKYRRYFLCDCDCGNQSRVEFYGLLYGQVKSCGCYSLDNLISRSVTHGKSKTKTYKAYCEMKRRCQNPNSNRYMYYGGRGIVVCERWQSYENFIADMGEKPSPKHTLERKDNNGHYSPENCIWATQQEQMNNTRTNVFYEIGGRAQTLSQWAREYGHPPYRISLRVRRGWLLIEALETPNDPSPGGHMTRNRHRA